MASTWLVSGSSTVDLTVGAGVTAHNVLIGFRSPTTTEAIAQTMVRDTYTGSNLWARSLANASDGVTTIRTRKAGANAGQSITFAAGVSGVAEDTVNTDAMATGELWNFSIANAGGTGNFGFNMVSLLLQHSGTGNFPLVASVATGVAQTENLVQYFVPGGFLQAHSTETSAQYTFRVTATLSNFRIYISANSIGAATSAGTRKNAGAGGQSVSITASTTGAFEDTVNTDSVVAGDEFNYVLDSTSSKMGSVTATLMQVESTTTGRQCIAKNSSNVSNVLRYWPVEGAFNSPSATTESNVQLDARTALTIANMYAYVSANTRAANTVVAFRKNGASAGPTVTFGSSVTGAQEDTVNTTTLVDGDLINYSVDGTAATGDTTFTVVGVESQQGAGGTAIDGAVKGVGILASTLVPHIPITAALQRYNYTWA